MTDESVVLRDQDGAVVTLTLHRPGKANAWGPDMSDALYRHLADLARDPSVRACILTGAGDRTFSSGADISNANTHRAVPGAMIAESWVGSNPVFSRLLEFPKPLLAAVNGKAIGAGFLLALCCDLIIASDTASFALPQVRLGIIPAYGGIGRLAQWVGRGRAMEIVLTGRAVGAEEAMSLGLLSYLHTPQTLRAEASQLASGLSRLPPLSVKLAKESMVSALEHSTLSGTAMGDLYRTTCLQQTEDSHEAHVAWRERREPNFVSR